MILVYILLILILATLAYFLYRQSRLKPADPDLSKAIDTLITVANQKLGEQKQVIQTDLSNKKDSIEKMVKQVLDQLSSVEKERIGSFSGLKEAIEQTSKITKELSATTEGLKKTLSSDRMRGAFGEKVAEDLLKQFGFVIGKNYSKQETFGEGRPDFTVYLPDKTKINIDAKFPYANIVKMSETDNADQKGQFLKDFESDIKRKITDVSSRNYINPEENTVDFVVVFIPNEMIFSFIYEKFPNILEEAFVKKIVFAGPFSFVAILRMVSQAYENFRFQKNIQGIITQVKIFDSEFEKYTEEFIKFGDRIDSLHKQYEEVSNTRTKKLQKVIDKIRIEDKPPEVALHE
jgi:DNA recombination protein RmuC